MTDESRRAPQWGEYATPEEVDQLRGAVEAVAPAPAPEPAPVTPLAEPSPLPMPPPVAGTAVRPRRGWDLMATTALLVVGFVTTISSFSQYLDFGDTLTESIALTGYTSVDFGADADTAGLALLAIHSVLFLAALGVSVALLQRRRLAFWVPLTAGVLSFVGDVVVMGILILGNPAYTSVFLDRS